MWPPVAGHSARKARCLVKTAQRKWVCRNCGRRNKTVAAASGAQTCEYCTEVTGGAVAASPEPSGAPSLEELDDSHRRGVVARLRQRYGEARGASAPEESDPHHSAHLEWILGAQRDRLRDEAEFDPRVSELVVLWLQDFAQQLDQRQDVAPAEESRHETARDLRAAASDFADAFLSPRPEGRP
jgi:hypothetical protein